MAQASSTFPSALLEHRLRLRFRDGRALLPYGQQLAARTPAEPALQAVSDLLLAWGRVAHGERALAEAAWSRAAQALAVQPDADATAVLAIIAADIRRLDGYLDPLLRVCEAALAQPEAHHSHWVRQALHMQHIDLLELLGRNEEALRLHYEQVARARALQAQDALGGLGGLQCSLMNLQDALSACEEAFALCEGSDWYGSICIAAIKLMSTRSQLGQHDAAQQLAEQMMAMDEHFPARPRALRHSLYATSFARAGRFERAQHCLDKAQTALAPGAQPRAEWVWVQAMVHNGQGQPALALALVLPYIEAHRDELRDSRFPTDHAQLSAQAARASEAQGDFKAAVHFERQAGSARERAQAQAADVRRLKLQIDHDLDTARRLRDDVQHERQRAEAEQQRLAELNLHLEAANAAKTRFLAAASHDLRQPVQALALYMAALEREPLAASGHELVGCMSESLRALGGLFDVLLDVSRLDAGVVPVNAQTLPLAALLRRLVHEMQSRAQAQGLQLRLHQAPGAQDAAALSDPALLEGVLRNLLDNALKYTSRGGVVLRLGPGRDAGSWRVEVRDTGIGIASAQQAQVFHEFFQIGNAERDHGKGLGLGLAIVKRTVELLGHLLALCSRPGRGSSFQVELPRAASAAPAAAPEVAVATTEEPVLVIAVIDDDVAVRHSLAALLQR